MTLSNIDADADLDLSLFADVPGALPEAGDLSFDDQAEATGRSRFIGHARNVGQVQPLDVNTIGRSRFIGESADGSAVVQTEAPAESREDVVTESDFGPLAAVSSNRDDQAESVAAIVGPAEAVPGEGLALQRPGIGAVLLARADAAPEADACGVGRPDPMPGVESWPPARTPSSSRRPAVLRRRTSQRSHRIRR